MFPYINLGNITISTYYTAMFVGYLLMVALMLNGKRRQKYGYGRFKAIAFATAQLICGVLGCKILFILENLAWIEKNGLTLGGFSFYGAVFLSPIIMPLIGKMLGFKLPDSLDFSAICILAMLGTIRLGCFLNGCCSGILINIDDFYFTIPAQLIECICDFILLSVLIKYKNNGVAYGFLYPKFLLVYGCARFVIEFIRNTEKDWLSLSHAQWFSIAAILIGVVFEFVFRIRKRNRF